jgi:pilus assembly protein Flp/PilA
MREGKEKLIMAYIFTSPKVSEASVTIPAQLSDPTNFTLISSLLVWNGKGAITMKTFCKILWQDTQGQDLVEYALMVGLVAVAAVAVVPQMATQINTIFNKVTSVLTSAAG